MFIEPVVPKMNAGIRSLPLDGSVPELN